MEMKYQNIKSIESFELLSDDDKSGVFYFSHNSCNVGESVKEKVLKLIGSSFPKLHCYFIDVELLPELAGQKSIFAYPTIIVVFEGQEFYRFSRNISIAEMEEKIKRPYKMLFE